MEIITLRSLYKFFKKYQLSHKKEVSHDKIGLGDAWADKNIIIFR